MSSDQPANIERSKHAFRASCVAVGLAIAGSGGSAAAAPKEGGLVLQDGTIGYVLTDRRWAVYETSGGKAECPQGFNDGNREEFQKLFPNDGKQRSAQVRHGLPLHRTAFLIRAFETHP